MKQIIINSEELQTRVAVVWDGVLHDFFMERNDRDSMVGSIYKGKIKNLEPSLQAGFVDIGCGKNAFLHYWDMLPASHDIMEDEEDEEFLLEDKPSPQPRRQQGKKETSQQDPQGQNQTVNSRRKSAQQGTQEQNQTVNSRRKSVQQGTQEQNQTVNSRRKSAQQATQEQNQTVNSRRRDPQEQGNSTVNPRQKNRQGGQKQNKHKGDQKVEVNVSEPLKQEVKSKGLFSRLFRLFGFNGGVENGQQPLPSDERQNGKRQDRSHQQKRQEAQAGRKQQPQENQTVHGRKSQTKQPKKPSITVEDIPNLFKEGQEILVQVTKGPIGTKGARLTTNLSIPGRYLVLLPNSSHIGISKRVEEKEERDRLRKMMRNLDIPKNMGVICRTVGAGMKPEYFQRDLDLLLEEWEQGQKTAKKAPYCVYQEPDLAERTLRDCLTEDVDEIITDSEAVYKRAAELLTRFNLQDSVRLKHYQSPTPIFNKYNLSQQLDTIFNRKVNLPSGGYICIDETEALIAIDVNTGKNRSGKDQPETILATNLEAVREIARQLRLRDIGGLVVLDLIDMRSKTEQMAVYKALKELMAEDRAKTKVYPISPLGLLEMTRQREHESLESTIFDDCPYCKGRGLVKSATSMSVEIQRKLNEICAKRKLRSLTVCAHPRILERLKNEDHDLFADIEMEFRAEISFQADSTLHVEDYQILDSTTGQKI